MFYYARMIERSVTPIIEHSLAEQAAVAIIGPRQVGKTTLARAIADQRPSSVFLDLEVECRLEMCQWIRETLYKESVWDEARSTSPSRW